MDDDSGVGELDNRNERKNCAPIESIDTPPNLTVGFIRFIFGLLLLIWHIPISVKQAVNHVRTNSSFGSLRYCWSLTVGLAMISVFIINFEIISELFTTCSTISLLLLPLTIHSAYLLSCDRNFNSVPALLCVTMNGLPKLIFICFCLGIFCTILNFPLCDTRSLECVHVLALTSLISAIFYIRNISDGPVSEQLRAIKRIGILCDIAIILVTDLFRKTSEKSVSLSVNLVYLFLLTSLSCIISQFVFISGFSLPQCSNIVKGVDHTCSNFRLTLFSNGSLMNLISNILKYSYISVAAQSLLSKSTMSEVFTNILVAFGYHEFGTLFLVIACRHCLGIEFHTDISLLSICKSVQGIFLYIWIVFIAGHISTSPWMNVILTILFLLAIQILHQVNSKCEDFVRRKHSGINESYSIIRPAESDEILTQGDLQKNEAVTVLNGCIKNGFSKMNSDNTTTVVSEAAVSNLADNCANSEYFDNRCNMKCSSGCNIFATSAAASKGLSVTGDLCSNPCIPSHVDTAATTSSSLPHLGLNSVSDEGNDFLAVKFQDLGSVTCRDLQALDVHFSRKMRDYSKTHHMLDDAVFCPRKKLIGYRHPQVKDGVVMFEQDLVTSTSVEAENHHCAPIHLRHVIGHHVRHHVSAPYGSLHTAEVPTHSTDQSASPVLNRHHHSNGLISNGHGKNVSFADIDDIYLDNDARDCDRVSMDADEGDRQSQISDDAGIIFTVLSKRTEDSDLSETLPTAAETSLPWKRVSSRNQEPISSSWQHELPDDKEPVRDDVQSWVTDADYVDNVSQCYPDECSAERKCEASEDDTFTSSHLFNCNEVVQPSTYRDEFNNKLVQSGTCPEEFNKLTNGSFDSYAISGSYSMSCITGYISVVSEHATYGTVEPASRYIKECIEDGEYCDTLPLPWKSDRCASFANTRFIAQLHCLATDNESSLRKCCSMPSNEISDSLPALPLPWRNLADISALPDQQAPRSLYPSSQSEALLPWRADSASPVPSFDRDSVRPLASCRSFLLSEAESRHSEPMMKQSPILEYVSRVSGSTCALEVLEDIEEMDVKERVSRWLEGITDDSEGIDASIECIDSIESDV